MKMKKACGATALTERAIRLYMKKGLIAPRQVEGIIEFTAEDIRQLRDIAILRQLGFTIEQIDVLLHEPQAMEAVLRQRKAAAQASSGQEQDAFAVLDGMEVSAGDSLQDVMEKLRAGVRRISPPEVDFGQFDETSEDEREQGKEGASREIARLEKRGNRRSRLTAAALIAAVLLVVVIAFLASPRISGNVSITPMQVEARNSETITLRMKKPQAWELLGTDTITVPYRMYGKQYEAGETIELGAQLAVELSNFDLLRIGINPLQSFQTRSAELHNQWMRMILHSLFAHGAGGNAVLWVGDISTLQPLLWPTE